MMPVRLSVTEVHWHIIIIVYYAKWQHRQKYNYIPYTKYKNTFTKRT